MEANVKGDIKYNTPTIISYKVCYWRTSGPCKFLQAFYGSEVRQ